MRDWFTFTDCSAIWHAPRASVTKPMTRARTGRARMRAGRRRGRMACLGLRMRQQEGKARARAGDYRHVVAGQGDARVMHTGGRPVASARGDIPSSRDYTPASLATTSEADRDSEAVRRLAFVDEHLLQSSVEADAVAEAHH